jgi:mannose-6-phosphate isomerase-like protein (cupin superfamily)
MSLVFSKSDREQIANFVTQNIWGYEIIAPEATEGKLSCCRLIIPSGESFPIHIHHEAHLLFCIEGQGFIEYFEAGTAKRFDLAKGDTCYIPSDVLHASGSDVGIELLVVDVPGISLTADNRIIEVPLSESKSEAAIKVGDL